MLKTLVSIKQMFNLRDICNSSKQMSQDYVLRGMICFTEGGHYLAFFRRILIKMEHLVSHDSNVKQELRKMER